MEPVEGDFAWLGSMLSVSISALMTLLAQRVTLSPTSDMFRFVEQGFAVQSCYAIVIYAIAMTQCMSSITSLYSVKMADAKDQRRHQIL